ncbi:MAG: hypothetical protein Q8L54_00540 [Devosia sp.]|nr:hypothetical protein [Devosia sp.]
MAPIILNSPKLCELDSMIGAWSDWMMVMKKAPASGKVTWKPMPA